MAFPSNEKESVLLVAVAALLGLAVAFLAVAAGAVKVREYAAVGSAPLPRTLSVSGTATVRATPDVASVEAGISVERPEAAAAQSQMNVGMVNILREVRSAGIPDADIRTSNYSVYPLYEYGTEGKRTLRGYEANQSVTIRIRELDRVNAVLEALRAGGATNVGSLRFDIDDPEVLRVEARANAIARARAQAETIASALGVRLGEATSFSESGGIQPPIFYERALGMGGGGAAPDVQAGENEVQVTVSVTYAME